MKILFNIGKWELKQFKKTFFQPCGKWAIGRAEIEGLPSFTLCPMRTLWLSKSISLARVDKPF